LIIAMWSNWEKVLYASGCLTGPAADWWDSYTAAHDAADTITWAEFATQFRNYHIPAGLMKIKKKEFLSLKQGSMSVSEYLDRFIQLSRYAPDEVAEDERKQEHFLKGLNGPLQYAMVVHTFPSFQSLLDKALAMEHKRVQLGDMKNKAISQGQGSSSVRPRYVPFQGTAVRTGGGQHPAQYTPQGTPSTRQAAPTGTPTKFSWQSASTTCYKCGKTRHYANVCPQRIATTPVQNKSRLQDLAKDSALPGLIKSVLMLLLKELTSLLVCFILMQFLQQYYLILVLHIHLCLLDMPTQMSYHCKILKHPW
jgi:hypothetical protein